jgi:hypothetical protein
MSTDKSNIHQKLIEVRKSVRYLKKDSKGFQFQYVSSSSALGSLREAMDSNQLLLIPRVVKSEIRDHTTRKGDHEYFTTLEMEFTWVNAEKPSEMISCSWIGCGLDDGEKGIGKAVTYAEKYFLLKFFNIATDKDDPDSFQKKHENGTNSTPPAAAPKQDPKHPKTDSIPKAAQKPGKNPTDPPEPFAPATHEQRQQIFDLCKSYNLENGKIKNVLGIIVAHEVESTATLTEAEAIKIIATLHDKKKAQSIVNRPF